MSAANVRAIRPAFPIAVQVQIEQARHMIFQAHSIAAVTAAAAVSQMPADEHCTETTLGHLAEFLDKVAAMLDPVALAEVSQ